MKRFALSWLIVAPAFIALDFVWLSRMGDSFYRPQMGDMALAGFRGEPALLFYLIYTGGLALLAVGPALERGGWRAGLARGAGLGVMAYATYDLTNQATLKVWASLLSAVDMAWGTLASAIAAAIATAVLSKGR
jgi:uncharacterized membrane protein